MPAPVNPRLRQHQPARNTQRTGHMGDRCIDADDKIELRNDGGSIGEIANLPSEAKKGLKRCAFVGLGFGAPYLQADKTDSTDGP
jgi:hypothetical protein